MNGPSERDGDTEAQRNRRQRMLDATITLASSGGFDAVQMRAVAERADVALGTLYRYFPSKVHLLVSALDRELEQAALAQDRHAVPGATPYDRVLDVLGRYTRMLQRDPLLTEAMTRAYVFADVSAVAAIHGVERQVLRLLTGAMHDPSVSDREPSEHDVAVAKVIGDVWLASLVQWVTGRARAEDVSRSMEVAVRLLLR